ncbi:FtsQ-type POTRA domain-containing protein [Caloramator sp. E03]|uniref:cell division protein FtsQ/DivIB n=1 Tax=Caloramator sp. E03 TaxID=2576307 RepID=UPI0011107CE7|nr:FtsQ-type POTRA domain-containing protein [Caloramator sp. E03]QCX32580.1 FtsQ-type POTRA domain-containing protein [Caloramator sp. E03]
MKNERIEKKIRRRRKFLNVCFLLIFIGIFLTIALKSKYFVINKIIINNNKYVKKEELLALCEAKGKNIFLVKKDKISEKIKSNPYIESVNIKKRLPSTIIINVQEKKVKGLIKFDNAFINLDESGNMIQTVNQFPDGSIPLIEGISVKQYIPGQNIAQNNPTYQKVLKEVLSITDFKECKNVFYSINISDPLNIVLTTKSGIQVCIGDSTNLEYKLSYAISILNNEEVKKNKGIIEILPEGTAIFRKN